MSARSCAYVAAVVTLLASGALYHSLGKDSAQLDDAAARIALVPNVGGDWHGQDEPADAGAFAQAGAKAYWTRLYVNQKTKASVLVILMCGRSGKMAVHTPEVCYGGAGFELHDTPAPHPFKSEPGERTSQFWTAHFTKKTTESMKHLRLYWAWNARGPWEASSSPRWQFRGEPFLYKLYVARDTGQAPTGAPQTDPAAEFLRTFLPALNETLFPRASTAR